MQQSEVATESIEVVYLTNALGEDTGHGTISVKKADLKKVAFECGPGYILPYIVEIKGCTYVMANLEIAHKDSFWSDNENYLSFEEVQAYCGGAKEFLKGRLTPGAMLLPIEDDCPGRLIIRVGIPLKYLRDAEHTTQVIEQIFGEKLARGEMEFT
jgi:hypothetical protein